MRLAGEKGLVVELPNLGFVLEAMGKTEGI